MGVARLLLELAEERDGRQVIERNADAEGHRPRVGCSREMISRIFTDLTAGGYVRKEDGKLSCC